MVIMVVWKIILLLPVMDMQCHYLKYKNKFAEFCQALKGHPKVFYVDCCRGQQSVVEDKGGAKGGGLSKYTSNLSDIYIHYATCDDHKAYFDDKNNGSYLIN